MRDDYLKTAFNMFDKDGSGKIDKNEVIQLLRGNDLTTYVCKRTLNQAITEIEAFDQDGDGEIDFTEFMAMMRKVSKVDEHL